MQDLYDLDDAVHGITVSVLDGVDEFVVAQTIRSWGDLNKRVLTWEEQWSDFFMGARPGEESNSFITLFVILAISIAIGVIFYLSICAKLAKSA
ncbi:MAG: hypothetical protein LR015_04565 [Verrucomicrobia bacterium]|nr:hypothetical protein [Verrucomicrobiota bacterium]